MIENKNEYKVYCLLFPDGKRYIGSTKLKMDRRFTQARYKQKKVHAAIDEFGRENIEVIILCEGLTCAGAHEIEQKFIDYYDVCNPEKGYNTLRVQKNVNSEEARRKNRESSLKFYEQHPYKAKELSDKVRQYYEKHPEARLHQRSLNKCIPVRCLDTGIIYPSMNCCAKTLHISVGNIFHVCENVRMHAGGLRFEYA